MLALALRLTAAEPVTLTLTDGASLSGDIVKFDDNGVLLRATGDVYTNLAWAKFSQATLKQLTANPKLKPLVEPFIEPDVSQRPPKAEIQITPVKRMELPANPSLFGGLVKSPVGLFVLLMVYLANLYAAFEVSVVRARPALQVVGLSAILPIAGPVIFLAMPMYVPKPTEEEVAAGDGKPIDSGTIKPTEEIKIVDASWKKDEKKVEAQVFARGPVHLQQTFRRNEVRRLRRHPGGRWLEKHDVGQNRPGRVHRGTHRAGRCHGRDL